ncbi:Alkylated DNA nucleotide flippase Atl1, participates in nucleotide excision repair, Ada-like DNA-binding domain [Actinopolyspora xinjiangensis]|uniref:Alkylated DNA nucleotide flippase Atl1, participates in nucleotide excision repair, Ada-like DNA-binding domain n=1 Tax=Actinopolyspora xinjiangensis TaxID=405564 RepID=A0A1H0VZW4_9ACTN|nr:MGMT family protein [Actinopolyspora xinjiangensis]SDP83676.1 Alkylated DNA nucleotide flippase Atl1, participates in nucleotide excision repair, Ada-like DNA-binding domain [Actinopolyspora xinjiangensis]
MDERTWERVREVVAGIPAGHVLGYGDVARHAGIRSARLVGRILAEDGADLPWHRVLRSDGTVAEHLRRRQLAELHAEGVAVGNGRVDMRRHRWEPGAERASTDGSSGCAAGSGTRG